MDVTDMLATARVLPVLVIVGPDTAAPLGEALAIGGATMAEVTLRTDAAPAAIRALAQHTDLIVGAGTVLSTSDVELAVDAGARFVVSPGLSATVVRRAQELGVGCVPGIATATELQAALELGITTVKFFPAREAGGVATIRALSAPFQAARFVPTGGIREDDLRSYLDLPSVVAVGGTWLAPVDLLAAADWVEITRRTASALSVAQSFVGKGH